MLLTDIFNEKSINVFVDASVSHVIRYNADKETIGCTGMLLILTDDYGNEVFREQRYAILRHSTNNDAEIKAIHYGLDFVLNYMAMNNLQFENVNIFSDSQICINGLTDWIFSWINNSMNNVMYSSSGDPVANQHTFKAIFSRIMSENIHINFYHQKGHVTNTKQSLYKALDCFKKSNKVRYVELDLIERISEYNNEVDIFTKQALKDHALETMHPIEPKYRVIDFEINKADSKIYRKLTKRLTY